MTKFTGNSSKEIVRRMIREAVRARMGLMTEGATTTSGDYEVSLTGTTVDDASVSWRAPDGEVVIAFDVSTENEATVSWNKEEKPEEVVQNPFPLRGWAKEPGLCTVTLTFGTWDGTEANETKAVTSDITLAETAAAPPVAAPPVAAPVVPAPVDEPQGLAMSIQEKIRTSAQAIQKDFADVYADVISLDDVKTNNQYDGHTWVDSTNGKQQFKLNDFSKGDGYNDKYTYFALVNDGTQKPIAFVVASDPTKDGHFSTGRFIGPTSQRSSLKNAFCVLYHRATGEVHESCRDNGPGSENDKYGKGGKGENGGAGSSDSSSGSGGTSGGGAASGSSGSGVGQGAVKLVSRDGSAVRGRGDAITGILGIGLRPAEKLRGAGYKIITKSKDKQGFTSFPKGPDMMFKRDPDFTAGGAIPPSSLAVRFKRPMAIITDVNGQNPRINFGANKSSSDILFIKLGWGGRGVRLVKLNPEDPGFDVAAEWVLANQDEFDLSPDGITVKNTVDTGAADKTNTGSGAKPAVNRGSSISESVRHRSLLDLYRF